MNNLDKSILRSHVSFIAERVPSHASETCSEAEASSLLRSHSHVHVRSVGSHFCLIVDLHAHHVAVDASSVLSAGGVNLDWHSHEVHVDLSCVLAFLVFAGLLVSVHQSAHASVQTLSAFVVLASHGSESSKHAFATIKKINTTKSLSSH